MALPRFPVEGGCQCRAVRYRLKDWVEPVGNIWTDSKAAWVKIDPELVNFLKKAMDRTPLFDAWTRHNQD
jgi:hypothetical protein